MQVIKKGNLSKNDQGSIQQKYLQKQGGTMKHHLCASISSGSGSTFNVQL